MEISEKIVLNVGLNNNPYNNERTKIHYLIARMFQSKTTSKVFVSEYKGVEEDTVVAVIDTKHSLSDIVIKVEALCLLFEQECIAVKSETFELLVWNPEAESREFGFDREYFIFAQ